MKKLTIILDAAHGEETPGKRSPDEKFREYKWSRETIAKLKKQLESLGYEVFESNPTDKEIGLSKRVHNTNKIARRNKIFISLHSDAAGNGSTWMSARGYSVYTTFGQNNSDKVAEVILNNMQKDFPELRGRFDNSDGDKDKEANFQVIKGVNCRAVLIEWCFQDNKEDVEILLSEEYNKKLVSCLVKSINELNEK